MTRAVLWGPTVAIAALVLAACGSAPSTSTGASTPAWAAPHSTTTKTTTKTTTTSRRPTTTTTAPSTLPNSIPEIRNRKIYRNSKDFNYLAARNTIQPGGQYLNGRSGTLCSFGWTVRYKSEPSRRFNLTAGHCGKVGDKVYIKSTSGSNVNVGEFVWQNYAGESRIATGADYSLIEFYDEYKRYITSTPKVRFNNLQAQLAGWRDADWMTRTQPYVCRLGWRSGLSCGNFQLMTNALTMRYDNISDSGDSGGVVWAMDPSDSSGNRIYAIGVTSFMQYTDATSAGAKIIGPVMEDQELQILR